MRAANTGISHPPRQAIRMMGETYKEARLVYPYSSSGTVARLVVNLASGNRAPDPSEMQLGIIPAGYDQQNPNLESTNPHAETLELSGIHRIHCHCNRGEPGTGLVLDLRDASDTSISTSVSVHNTFQPQYRHWSS